ncbi:MAG: hypothetical protein RLY31_1083 [Bacteroidota bacterium]|jgi:deoxyribodipyrimidine photo-lyase
MKERINIFWFRRDLRLEDNTGFYHALRQGLPVLPIFIFDRNILDRLNDPTDARVTFIHRALRQMNTGLEAVRSSLRVYYGDPVDILDRLVRQYEVDAVYTNRDYEPYARERDGRVERLLAERGIAFRSYKDHVVFERLEVAKDDGTPYTVFTPYSRKWMARRMAEAGAQAAGQPAGAFARYPSEEQLGRCLPGQPTEPWPTLADMGFSEAALTFPPASVPSQLIAGYAETRDYPALAGTSRLGVHFRFGTISIREKARKSETLSKTFLNELIWRDFYSMILWNFPHVATGPFREAYAAVEWRDDQASFDRWRAGETGYPLVDAGMRELTATGYMHNRVRMVVASFLSKHLLLPWQWGEAWFAEKLLDFDLASNNGGWQWAAGCGTDAAPYFRIFNPAAQLQKFDRSLDYVRRWVPEYGSNRYPKPMVEHAYARQRCLETYRAALGG